MIGIQITHVLCIAMTKACRGEAFTIIINDHRSEYNLIASVEVDIGHTIVMIALSLPRTSRFVEPSPALRQFVRCRVHIIGNHLVTSINASGQEDTGLATIKARRTKEVLRGTVAAIVLTRRGFPCLNIVTFTIFIEFQGIRQTLVGFARLSIHI